MLQHDRTLTELFAEQCRIPVLLPRVLLGDEDPGRLEARQPGGGGHVDAAVIAIPHHHPLPEVPANMRCSLQPSHSTAQYGDW